MAYYYVKNQIGSNNISLRDLYRLKGVNLNEDKVNNFRLSPYASNTEGSHLGPGVNPWIIAFFDPNTGNSPYGGMVQFNDPNGSTGPNSPMGSIRGVNHWYSPYHYGSSASTAPKATSGQKVVATDTLDTSGLAAGWVHVPYMRWYTFEHSANLNIIRGNWLSIHRRSNLDEGIRLHVGYLTASGDDGSITQLTDYASTTITNVSNGNIALNNVGQGDGTPYNEGGDLGSSTYATVSYRNSAGTTQFRVITLNQDYSVTPSISVSGATTYNNQGGSALFFHSNAGINMGKGVQWTMAHRGANWIKIFYTRLTGTTVNAHNGYTVVNLGSTTTLTLKGDLVKISDEAAIIIAPHRNGASSGNSRRLVAHTLYAGANKIPTIRSSFAASYDWGSTDTQSCAADAGSSDTDGTVFGLAVYARSGTSECYFISWKYNVVTDTFAWQNASIINDRSGYQSDTWRSNHSVIHMGYNNSSTKNYYHVVFSGGSGDYHYTLEQDARNSQSGALSITQEAGKILGTSVERSCYTPLNFEGGMPWFVNKPIASNYSGVGGWLSGIWFTTADDVQTGAVGYSFPGL